jgi:hypothetical protein
VLVILGLLFFLAFVSATRLNQHAIALRPPLLVGFFLAALIIHGGCCADKNLSVADLFGASRSDDASIALWTRAFDCLDFLHEFEKTMQSGLAFKPPCQVNSSL